MNNKKIRNILKIIIIAIAVVLSIYFATPVFASMGSTGGGAGGGGSTGGGGGSHSGGSSGSGGNILYFVVGIVIAQVVIFILIYLFFWFTLVFYAITDKIKDIYVYYQYKSDWLRRKEYYHMARILNRSPDRAQFDLAFQVIKESGMMKNVGKDVEDNGQWEGLKETYINAQFLYSQLLRQRLTNKNADISQLKKYLDEHFFYKTMVKEIKLKSNSNVVDDTIVDKVEILQIAQFGGIYLTKVKVWGQDKEIQYDDDLNPSFNRSEWSDYVIFGKNRKGQIKILTLMYGEHAHLNGRDFNADSSLDENSKYYEKNHSEKDDDYYRKLNKGKQKRN